MRKKLDKSKKAFYFKFLDFFSEDTLVKTLLISNFRQQFNDLFIL